MRRSAATLVEVLVAIFVMGIGLIALLTLFPLGALRMAQAIQDERAATIAHNAYAICNFKGVRHDDVVLNDLDLVAGAGAKYDVFKDPDGPPYPGNIPPVGTTYVEADPQGPSYAVLVDPTGCRTAAGLDAGKWVGDQPWLLRRNTSFATSNTEALRWFAALDDIYFDENGGPRMIGLMFERDIRFSYALLLQRPKTSNRSVTHVSVVVYHQRPLSLSGLLSLNEFAYGTQIPQCTFDTSKNTVTINYSSTNPLYNTQPPPVRPGDWILDATVITTNGLAYPHANFYRVVALNEDAAASTVELELQQPIRGTTPPGFNLNTPNSRTIVVLEGVVEVFDKGPGKYLDQ